MRSHYKRLGDYITEVNARNTELKTENLLGINIDKYYMPSVANIVGTDLTNYKIVKKWQFACNRMHVGRDKRLPVALSSNEEDFIVSPAYDVFEITDANRLLPEYLMMWFSRKEFDRNAWFYTDADIRGGLPWTSFCDLLLPLPHPDRQKELVAEYNIILDRISLNRRLLHNLEEAARAIYRQWFVHFEFLDESGGRPYKSNGGEMWKSQYGEIPRGWRGGTLGDLIELQRGFDLPTQERLPGSYPIYASTGITGNHRDFKVKAPGLVTGRSGSLGEVFYVDEDFWPLNTTLWVKEFKNATPIFAYYVLKSLNIQDYNSGSAVPTLNRNHIHRHELIVPDIEVIERFEKIEKVFFSQIKQRTNEQKLLNNCLEILLSKLATIDN